MIHLKNVSKRYVSNHEALSNVSFDMEQGELLFLTGHSGAGKSTLLKLISLLELQSGGEIIVNGQNISHIKNAKKIARFRRQFGLIFQNPYLLDDRSIFDNVALPLIISGCRYKEIGRRVRAALDKVGLLNKERLLPKMLSCGEQQRVGIARAIVRKPTIILADEPTGNLDPELSKEIMLLFELFRQTGVTLLIASHDVNLIEQFSHRILILNHGRLINLR